MFPQLYFTLENKVNRIEQVAESFKHGNPLFVMADSGGPYFQIKPGLAKIADATSAQFVPVAFHMSQGLQVGKVLKHRCPLPFSKIKCFVGSPISFLPSEDLEKRRFVFQNALEQLERNLNPD